MPAPADDFLDRSRYSVSTDRQWRLAGGYRGQSLIWDAHRNRYVTDDAGDVITFPTAYDAEQWLERQWVTAHGIDPPAPA
jgi:hypothetical protein